jgi:hypothetical protein
MIIEQEIDLYNNNLTYTGSGTDLLACVSLDMTKYDNVIGVYVQYLTKYTYGGPPDSGGSASWQLYNDTDGEVITASIASSTGDWGLSTVKDITGYCASHPTIKVRLRTNAINDLGFMRRCIIRIVQLNPTKTRTMIPLANHQNITAASYAVVTGPKRWIYTSGNYDGTVTVSFGCSMRVVSAANTAYGELYDVTAGAAIADSEVSITGTTASDFLQSGSLTLTSGNILDARFKISTAGQTMNYQNSFLIIDQDGNGVPLTKLQTVVQVINMRISQGGTTYIPQIRYNSYNNNNYKNCTVDFKHEAVLAVGFDVLTAYADLTDDGTEITSSELTCNVTDWTIKTSGSLTAPTGDANQIDSQTKCSAALPGLCTSTRIVLTITDGVVTPRLLTSIGVGT